MIPAHLARLGRTALVLAIGLLACPLNARDLFEDEPAKPPANDGSFSVPHTPEARQLAKDLQGKFKTLLYSIEPGGVTAFAARYGVGSDGLQSAVLHCQWDAKTARVQTRVEAKPGFQAGDRIAWLAEMCLDTCLTQGGQQDVPAYAVKSGKTYFISVQAPAEDQIKAYLMFVDEDFLTIRRLIVYPDARTIENTWKFQQIGPVHYAAAMTILTQGRDKSRRQADLALTYLRRDGVPFIKRLVIDDDATGGKKTWTLSLLNEADSLQLTRRTQAAQPEVATPKPPAKDPDTPKPPLKDSPSVPHTPQAQQLGLTVLAKLCDAYYSVTQAGLETFEAPYTVQRDGRAAGTLTVSWDRQRGLRTQYEGPLDQRMLPTLRGGAEYVFRVTVLGAFPAKPDNPVYAVAAADGYLLEPIEPGYTSRVMVISKDYTRLRDTMGYADGKVIDTFFETLEHEGKHLVKSMRRIGYAQQTEQMRIEFLLSLAKYDKVVFLKAFGMDESWPEGRGTWRLTLQADKLRLAGKGEPQVTAVRPEPDKPRPKPDETVKKPPKPRPDDTGKKEPVVSKLPGTTPPEQMSDKELAAELEAITNRLSALMVRGASDEEQKPFLDRGEDLMNEQAKRKLRE